MIKKAARIFLSLSILSLFLAFVLPAFRIIPAGNIFWIAGFSFLALSFRYFEKLKGFAYTVWIFAAVSVAMIYPQYFQEWYGFSLKILIVPLLQIIMFGMGSQMSLKDFSGIIQMPKGVLIGIVCQFTIMPLLGISIATLFGFPPEIAAGLVLIGSSPSGLASNVMSFLARANLALSVTLSAVATLLAPLLTPLLMKLLAGQFIEVKFWSMMLDIINIIILPIIAGFIFNLFAFRKEDVKKIIIQMGIFSVIILLKNLLVLSTTSKELQDMLNPVLKDFFWFFFLPMGLAWLIKSATNLSKQKLEKFLAFLSMLGIAIIIVVITAAGQESLVTVGFSLLLACVLHNTAGYFLGYSAAKIFRMPEKDCRTVAFEVGMQNGGLASGLALQMGKVATVGLAAAIFGPLQNITGSVLANYWRSKEDKNQK